MSVFKEVKQFGGRPNSSSLFARNRDLAGLRDALEDAEQLGLVTWQWNSVDPLVMGQCRLFVTKISNNDIGQKYESLS